MIQNRPTDLRRAIRAWWGQSLGGDPQWDNGSARKARAELRRAASPADALALEATHDLKRGLTAAGYKRDWRPGDGPQSLALIAATLAATEIHSDRPLPTLFGELKEKRRVLSHLRFQRIVREDDPWRLAVLLRRALPIAGNTANVGRLGEDLLFWGERVQARWCFDYFGATPPDPLKRDAEPETTPDTEDA